MFDITKSFQNELVNIVTLLQNISLKCDLLEKLKNWNAILYVCEYIYIYIYIYIYMDI